MHRIRRSGRKHAGKVRVMASSIEQNLNKILSSRYGKDVRQSIHDGIKQCYDDVTNPDLNTEAFETAVQNKIDDGSLALMTIPDGSITKEKLDQDTNETIKKHTEDIADLKSALKQKINKAGWTANKFLGTDGEGIVVEKDAPVIGDSEAEENALPKGFKKVDYADSKGTLHFSIDWIPTKNSRMIQKVIPISGVNTFIGFAADNNLSFGYQIATTKNKVTTYLGDTFNTSSAEKQMGFNYEDYITINISNGVQKINGEEIGNKESVFDAYDSWDKYPIVGGSYQTWYAGGELLSLSRQKIVECQIYDSEKLIYDFVPALRTSDNLCGLYDLVNKTFSSGRTSSNLLESFDYGKVIESQSNVDTSINKIVVKELTGDAIQSAINQCRSSGGGVIELLPGNTYKCDSPLTIYTDRVDIIGNGAKLDFSGISSDIVCVTLQSSGDISDYSEMIREEYLHYIQGVYFIGPNRTANYEGGRIGTALMFTGTETKISTGYTVDNCVIAGFKTGVDLFTNSWCVKFSNCDISVCDTGIQMISGGQNYGEKFTFTSCTIHACSVGAVCNHYAGTLQFLGCAMDYNFCAFKTDNQAHIIFTGGHIENNKDKNYFCICSNFGIVLIANSVLHGSQTQYGFASVSEAGKVIMSNCMKESWTMGEDEKDDNGNSKIIYDWINFAS